MKRFSKNSVILVIGYGSIGKRHVQNLLSLGYRNIILLRSARSKEDETLKKKLGLTVVHSERDAYALKPSVVCITNVTYKHIPYALRAARAKCDLFIEKPLSSSLRGVQQLTTLASKWKLVTLVGCNQRFHPQLEKIKDIIDSGKVGEMFSARVEVGQYLPDWHPGENFRASYAAKKSSGGGVILTLIHEIDYVLWTMGVPSEITGIHAQSKHLHLPVEDNAEIILRHRSGAISEIHLDYLQRALTRQYQFFGTQGSILWDYGTGLLSTYMNKSGSWSHGQIKNYDRNAMFKKEMAYFLTCVQKRRRTMNTVSDAVAPLRVSLIAKKSSLLKKTLPYTLSNLV